MIEAIVYITIGLVVGWNLPQPMWAKNLQEKVVGWFRKKEE